jgi:hypothetical protein
MELSFYHLIYVVPIYLFFLIVKISDLSIFIRIKSNSCLTEMLHINLINKQGI